MENSEETPISTTPDTPIIPASLSFSAGQLAAFFEQLGVDDPENNEGTDAAATSTFPHDNGSHYYFPANVDQSHSQELGIDLDQRNQPGLHSSIFLPRNQYSSAGTCSNSNNAVLTGNHACFGVGRSKPNSNWLSKNIPFPFTDKTSPSPFPGFPSFSDWAPQDGVSNAATWLCGGADNLMQNGLRLNNGFSGQSPGMDPFAATGTNVFYSVSGWKRNSGGQDWLGLDLDRVVEEAMNEYGSKKLQVILAQNDERKRNMIFEKTFPQLLLIMTNKYGQFFFSRLIESCNPSQLLMIVIKVTSQIETLVAISCHSYGSQCVKKLIKVLEKSPLAARITFALSGGFFELMTHKTGSYAVLRCFEVLNCQQNNALYTKLIEQSIELATHEIGCLSLNRSISYIKGSFRDYLLRKISSKAAYLAHDPSGNFVIQYVIGLANPTFTAMICVQLREHYVALSTKIGGSHVVEKCLKSEDRQYAVQELLKCDKLGHIARDQYGNYVLQTALRETKRAGSPLHRVLLGKISSLNELHQGYGKKVLAFINKGVPLD